MQNLPIGERFHQETYLPQSRGLGSLLSQLRKRSTSLKTYPDSPYFKLPSPQFQGMILEEVIRKRRSIRNYSNKSLTLHQLSQLLFAAQGITGEKNGHPVRSSPSAGALYPIEIYVVVNKVDELDPGIYHYAIQAHGLTFIKRGDFRHSIARAALDQRMLIDASVIFVLTSVFDRLKIKYGERGYRYAYLEAGHISQNIYLQAVSLKLGSVCIGAFFDDDINRLIGVESPNEETIYLHSIGTI